MKLRILCIALAMSLTAPAMAQAPSDEAAVVPAPQALPFPDKDYSDLAAPEFFTRMAVNGRTTRQLALIARGRAGSQEVREYAERVIADQTAADEALGALAVSRKINLQTVLDSENQAEVDRLIVLLGEDFDREYLKSNLAAQEENLRLLEAASTLTDAPIAEFARSRMPALMALKSAAGSASLAAQADE